MAEEKDPKDPPADWEEDDEWAEDEDEDEEDEEEDADS
jgi:hypothetical protein